MIFGDLSIAVLVLKVRRTQPGCYTGGGSNLQNPRKKIVKHFFQITRLLSLVNMPKDNVFLSGNCAEASREDVYAGQV